MDGCKIVFFEFPSPKNTWKNTDPINSHCVIFAIKTIWLYYYFLVTLQIWIGIHSPCTLGSRYINHGFVRLSLWEKLLQRDVTFGAPMDLSRVDRLSLEVADQYDKCKTMVPFSSWKLLRKQLLIRSWSVNKDLLEIFSWGMTYLKINQSVHIWKMK